MVALVNQLAVSLPDVVENPGDYAVLRRGQASLGTSEGLRAETTQEIGNQDQWESALKGLGPQSASVGKGFGENRYDVMQRLGRAGVKHPRWEAAPLATFLDCPESFIDPVQSKQIHLFIEPAPGFAHERLRFKDISQERAYEIIEKLRSIANQHEFVATVLESPTLLYHGNVLVYDQKDCKAGAYYLAPGVTAEFVNGDSLPVSRAGVSPQFRFWQDPFTETYRYDFEEPALRQLFFQSLKLIPTLNDDAIYDGLRQKLVPGYYEIGIALEENGHSVRSFLYDMKPWGK